jgi:hypothetical protein
MGETMVGIVWTLVLLEAKQEPAAYDLFLFASHAKAHWDL